MQFGKCTKLEICAIWERYKIGNGAIREMFKIGNLCNLGNVQNRKSVKF